MTEPLSVLMTTEGTYPYGSGGVSTWCDSILRHTPDVSYTLLPLMMNPHIESRYEPPKNVKRVLNLPLWGTEEPAEFIDGLLFTDVYERKRRTSDDAIRSGFVPPFEMFLDVINGDIVDNEVFGRALVAMEDYFRHYDYNDTMKSSVVWEAFRTRMEAHSRRHPKIVRGVDVQKPTLFDLTECLRWLYRFLIVLNIRVPSTSITHSTAAAFCGIPCITAKIRRGTPMLLTEHGVYLREQNLFLSHFRRLYFCKQFLLNLITAVVRANYHYADIVSPVCHYNTRWELAHGTPHARIRVIYNGVDPDIFIDTPPPASEHFHVVATARIDPLKDIETLLRVAARVRETHPHVRFTVFGAVADQRYYERCLELRHQLHLDGVVSMGAPTNDVAAAYQSADAVILTSISEAFPYSILEAMSSARPVIASDVGGVSEAVEGCGILVKPRDVEGFAAAVRKLAGDASLRSRLGVKARAKVLDEFRLDQCVANYLMLYRELGARRNAA